MKRLWAVASLLVWVAVAGTTQERDSLFEALTENYRVYSNVSQEHAQSTADRLQAYMQVFNQVFHFDTEDLPTRLKVRLFSSKSGYDEYLQRVIKETRDDFVYIHYSDLSKSELVGFTMEDLELYETSLRHQAFVQFFKSFVSQPPVWMREGFAVYFEDIQYDEGTKNASYQENLAWLETLKNLVHSDSDMLGLEELLTATNQYARQRIDVFYPEAWGVVSFLMNSSDRDHNRIIWDAISALDPSATLAENSARVLQEAFRWHESPTLRNDFVAYVTERKSFAELVELGIAEYGEGDYTAAESYFQEATLLRPEHHIPHYYLGLVNYNRRDYQQADDFYRRALELGATPAITYYALGVNAYADNRFEEASEFLTRVVSLDPETYGPKAEDLLARFEEQAS
jgi:tetratricopeptide (TPR) repeat protein